MEVQTLLLTFGVIILSALAQSSMQLSTGVFLLLYRESAGRYLKKKTKNLLSNYIVGYIFLTSLLLTSICYALMVLFGGNLTILVLQFACGSSTIKPTDPRNFGCQSQSSDTSANARQIHLVILKPFR